MKYYENAPGEGVINPDPKEVKDALMEELKEELPESEVNEWFIDSIHFANMIDKIVRRMWKDMGVDL